MTTRYQKFVKAGLELAQAAHRDRDCYYQLCALVVKRNRVISVGYNNPKTHPLAHTKMRQLHAEMDAIIGCTKAELDGAEIVVVRARRDGKVGMAKPCRACDDFIRRVGLRRVYYTVDSMDINNPTFIRMDMR
jgi:deoxycytidylate deaminase